jgi:succinate dehydrogenase / fumarate reductase cytochrome b subunit
MSTSQDLRARPVAAAGSADAPAAAPAAPTESQPRETSPSLAAALVALVVGVLRALAQTILARDARTAVFRSAVLLLAFLVVHVAGNLAFLGGPGPFNAYADSLARNPLLAAVEWYLLAAFVAHAASAAVLTFRYKRAALRRGPLADRVAALRLALTGAAVAVFLGFHLSHFRFGPVLLTSAGLRDLYALQVQVLGDPATALGYLAAIAALTLHLYWAWPRAVRLLPGLDPALAPAVTRIGLVFALAVGAGFVVCVLAAVNVARAARA